eukprot:TRINITY_DN15633_c0_g1_i1.p1 TRINITY_DN15633_c0_g1~~TRINITY_DN15633_c0_g1_i1.p1  ORF type:complete len:222 (+),score=34.78 TRINITY_DN15633_c0_g1_i1:89-667(+)
MREDDWHLVFKEIDSNSSTCTIVSVTTTSQRSIGCAEIRVRSSEEEYVDQICRFMIRIMLQSNGVNACTVQGKPSQISIQDDQLFVRMTKYLLANSHTLPTTAGFKIRPPEPIRFNKRDFETVKQVKFGSGSQLPGTVLRLIRKKKVTDQVTEQFVFDVRPPSTKTSKLELYLYIILASLVAIILLPLFVRL